LSGVIPNCEAVRSYNRLLELQIAFELVHAARVGVGSWRNAERSFERALKMERALVEFLAQLAQRDWFIQVALDVAAYGFHHLRLPIAANRFRTAAQAGPVAGFLGFVGLAEKLDVFPARAP
jgi:hypothetical protein